MTFTAGLTLALVTVLSGSSTPAVVLAQPMPQAQTVQQYVQTYFAGEPIMVSIAECESHFHQYSSDGSVYRGTINNQDVGVMQINEHYHSKTAKALGLDLYTIQGNVSYAQYLYDNEGTAPWNSSKACWGKMQSSDQTLAMANK